jgi:hypothetical protein
MVPCCMTAPFKLARESLAGYAREQWQMAAKQRCCDPGTSREYGAGEISVHRHERSSRDLVLNSGLGPTMEAYDDPSRGIRVRMRLCLAALLVMTGWNVDGALAGPDGKADYLKYCASCHGETGKGGGPEAKVLKTPPLI